MAGRSRQLKYSLQWHLILTLSLTIMLMAIISGILAFRTAFQEAQDLQDTQLQHIALLLDPHSQALKTDSRADINFPETASQLPKPSVLAQTLDSPYLNHLLEDNHANRDLDQLSDGFHNYVTETRHWRVYLLTKQHQRIVVAQRTAYRNRIAQDSALNVLWPFMILMPILWLLSTLWIKRLFRATHQLSLEVATRNANDLSALTVNHAPAEIRPFISALNRLFSQLQMAIEHDKSFISHAAHELRTPVTALTLQIARFDDPNLTPTEQRILLNRIKTGIDRTEQLLTQLLSLARAQHQQHHPTKIVSTAALPLVRELVSEIWPLAEQKQQLIHVALAPNRNLPISHHDLYTILKNLIVNAIHYTPPHSTICVREEICTDQSINIWIEDNGQGVLADDKEHLFEPFYRILGHQQTGSGLGLAIVKNLCAQWHIDVALADSTLPLKHKTPGLAVVLTFKH